METLTISPRFFKHELNNYYEWEKAFWRELIQNSVDENCSKIEITLEKNSDHTLIRFYDNGPGMDENTLRNIYFNLGETRKEGCNTIGGHGRARIITCFAHEHYQIKTQTLLCKGSGGQFEIQNSLPYFRGCQIEVATKETGLETLRTNLEEYLQTCQLPCQVFINQTPFQDWLYKRKATRTLSFGTIHTTKKRQQSVLVRVKGVTMFERHSPCQTGVIIEVDPPSSRQILTASRDNLKYTQQRELDGFLAEIAIDNKSLNRDLTVNKTEIYGTYRTVRKPTQTSQPLYQTSKDPKNPEEVQTYNVPINIPNPPPHSQSLGTQETHHHENLLNPNKTPDYSIHYEDIPKKMVRPTQRFQPSQLSGNRLKLLKVWDETCRFFLEHLSQKTGTDLQYLAGFAFGPNIRGLHKTTKTQEGQGHILYINPLNEDGKITLSCHDHHTLFAIGAHEAAHILHPTHNEEYAGSLTTLVEETLPNLPQLKQRLKNCLNSIT